MSTHLTPAVIVPNSTEAHDPAPPPLREGTDPYRFEMIYDGGKFRAYADTADGLLAALIHGYDAMTDEDRLAARLHLAVRTQTTVQAAINVDFGLDDASPDEYAVLSASRATPPQVARWDSRVPLVLVDVFYAPIGDLARPQTPQDVADPDNLIWLSPSDPTDFVYSLRRIGLIDLGEHADYTG